MSQIVRAPTPVSEQRITGYRCDHCEHIHVVMQLKFPAPDDDGEAVIMVFQIPERIARGLLTDLALELENPAPGYEGGIHIPIIDNEED